MLVNVGEMVGNRGQDRTSAMIVIALLSYS